MQVLQSEPTNVKALYRLAKASVLLKEYDEACKFFEQTLALEYQAHVQRELDAVKRELAKQHQQQLRQFGGMFDRLASQQGGSLYQEDDIKQRLQDEKQSRMRKCNLCDAQVEDIQYARHVIKFHSS
jgi:hypothetical protein